MKRLAMRGDITMKRLAMRGDPMMRRLAIRGEAEFDFSDAYPPRGGMHR
jgi:hypothetical protein